jgi:RNA-binding protein
LDVIQTAAMNNPTPLTGAQRKWLRGQAHALNPVVRLGKQGLTDGVLSEIDLALESHELIKVQGNSKEENRELAAAVAEQLGAEAVGMIGHVAIFFRPHPDPDERKVVPPQSRAARRAPSSRPR